MPYKPPYTVDTAMQEVVKRIIRLIGRLEGYQLMAGNLRLRRKNQIKSLFSSLAIEGNRLSEEQITAILDGKRVIGPQQDIREVENAIGVYDRLPLIDPYREEELLSIHALLMSGLIADAGRYRQGGVGVVDGHRVIHLAPPAHRVPALMGDLFDYLGHHPEDIIVKSCVFHYEFEFIHPFSDGNGRMGRLWQTAILKTEYPDLAYLPIENVVYQRQQDYYQAFQASQAEGNSNPFLRFSLHSIESALRDQLDRLVAEPTDFRQRLRAFRERHDGRDFSRMDYQRYHKTISAATATRDLARGVEAGILEKSGKLRTTRYRYL